MYMSVKEIIFSSTIGLTKSLPLSDANIVNAMTKMRGYYIKMINMYDALEKKNFVIRKYIHYNHIKNEQFLNVEHSLHTIKVVSLMCRHSRLEISQQN